MEIPRLGTEHPTLTTTSLGMLELLRGWPAQLEPAPGSSAWMHHVDFAERADDLARHVQGALLLAESGLFFWRRR